MVAALLSSRSVAQTAQAWVERHAEWIETQGLPMLASWSHAEAETAAIRAALRGEAPQPPPKPAALKAGLKRLFKELPAQMKQCAGDVAVERVATRGAFETYFALNAALGAEDPDAYFTHQLDLDWDARRLISSAGSSWLFQSRSGYGVSRRAQGG